MVSIATKPLNFKILPENEAGYIKYKLGNCVSKNWETMENLMEFWLDK